jgi:hypothetical protein
LLLVHRLKMNISGNNDRGLDKDHKDFSQEAYDLFNSQTARDRGVYLLIKEVITIPVRISGRKSPVNVRFYGNPYQPDFYHDRGSTSSFTYIPYPDPSATKTWEDAPPDADIWVMHGPPHDRLDKVKVDGLHGCEVQLEKIAQARPRLCVFGHFHLSHGVERVVWQGNASSQPKSAELITKPEAVYDFSANGPWGNIIAGQQTVFVNASWMTVKKAAVPERNTPHWILWETVA